MKKKPDPSVNRKPGSRSHSKLDIQTATRLAAVQALYQIEFNGSSAETVIQEFYNHWIGKDDDEVDWGGQASETLLSELVAGTIKCQAEIDNYLDSVLDKTWPLNRIANVMRCILRIASFELISRHQVPAKVVVSEYVNLAHSFFSGGETGMVNGVLDKLAHLLRSDELESDIERESKLSQ